MFKGNRTERSDVSKVCFIPSFMANFSLVLQSKWKHLEKSLKKNDKLNNMYDRLKDKIQSKGYELKDIKKSIEECDRKENLNIKKVNRFMKDMKIKLSRMKPHLFELNLTVHNLIGEVCEDDFELKHLEADRVKEDLVEVYEAWDEVSLMVSERLARHEDTGNKLRTVEDELEEVTKFLTKETRDLVERRTNTDSGISDGSDVRVDRDKRIQEHEDTIMMMKETVTEISKNHPSSSFYLSNIIKALSLSSSQLNKLKTITVFSKPSVISPEKTGRERHPSKSHKTLKKLSKYWRLMSFLLLITLFVSVLTMPYCCEHSNPIYVLLPSITYTSGMRPM